MMLITSSGATSIYMLAAENHFNDWTVRVLKDYSWFVNGNHGEGAFNLYVKELKSKVVVNATQAATLTYIKPKITQVDLDYFKKVVYNTAYYCFNVSKQDGNRLSNSVHLGDSINGYSREFHFGTLFVEIYRKSLSGDLGVRFINTGIPGKDGWERFCQG